MTVLSGLDYFFGLRRRMQQAQAARAPTAERRRRQRAPASSHSSRRRLARGGLARLELGAQLGEQAVALGDDVVLVDRLEVLLARRDEARAVELGKARDDAGDHLAHAVLDEARPAVGLLDDLDLVGALHQLVDLRGHARLDDLEQRRGVDLGDALLDAADLQRRQAALVVGGDRHALEDALDLLVGEARRRRAARARARRRAPARTGRRSCPVAETPTMRRVPCSKATARPCSV